MLKLFNPDGTEMGPATAGRQISPSDPLPLYYFHVEHEGKEGPYTDTTVVWWNESGLRCCACRPGTCTFSPGVNGVGACTLRRPGPLAGAFPLPLGR